MSSVIFLLYKQQGNLLRHRRRYSTQTLDKKKKNSSTTASIKVKPAKNRKKYLRYFFIFVLAALAVYAVYDQAVPLLAKIRASLEYSGPVQNAANNNHPLPVEPEAETEIVLTPIQKKIQVEVLNGCGEQGIAKILTDRLREQGYDVVNSGNYIENGKTNFNVSKSKLIDQLKTSQNITNARELAEIIGIEFDLIESFENPSPISDLTIVIGKDFTKLYVFKN